MSSITKRSAEIFYAAAVLGLALYFRFVIFHFSYVESDELIYRALVEQLAHGNGFTLRGHPILAQAWMPKGMYDSPVFFHPPFGVYFFWLFTRFISPLIAGLKFAQLAAFSLFYVCTLLSVRVLLPSRELLTRALLPILVAFTPLYAHTNTKIWIENPRLAFFSLHILAVLWLAKKGNYPLLLFSAVTGILATLTKIDTVIALPFLYGLAFLLSNKSRTTGRWLIWLFSANILAAGLWLWYSNALHYGPGRPSAELIAMNEFVRFVTIGISPMAFLASFFKVVSTALPAILLAGYSFFWRERKFGPRELLVLWVLMLCLFYFFLGCIGYSKVLRYLLLTTPATCLLFAYAVNEIQECLVQRSVIYSILGALLLAGFFLEAYQGFWALGPGAMEAAIFPIF